MQARKNVFIKVHNFENKKQDRDRKENPDNLK